jgi:uncharacterized protein (TIGR03000 family)
MLRKIYLLPAILSLACLLTLTDFAQAQRRGGGGGSGGNRGGNNSGYRGGYYNGNHGYYNGNHGNYNDWWRGVGVYINPSLGYRYNYPYRTYDSYYYTPSYYDNTSYYNVPPTEYVQPMPPATVVSNAAHIRVILPDPAARVWFDDRLTSQQGSDRMFNTPSLTSSGTYRIRATWMQGTNEVAADRTVTVSPGQTVVVDFTRG